MAQDESIDHTAGGGPGDGPGGALAGEGAVRREVRATTWTGPDPSDITAWVIVQAGHAVGRRFWQALAAVGVTPIQFGILLNLDLTPQMSNAELARSVLITPQSMSEQLTVLQQLGLVRRDTPSGRGRRVGAELTDAGRDTLASCRPVLGGVESDLGLTPEQSASLRLALHSILAGRPDG